MTRDHRSRCTICRGVAAGFFVVAMVSGAASGQQKVTASPPDPTDERIDEYGISVPISANHPGRRFPSAEAMDAEIRVTAFLADEDLKLESSSLLYTRVEIPDGFHLYGAPLPEGYFETTVHVQEVKGIRVGDASYPETRSREFAALGVTLNVYEGVVEVATPVTATADALNWGVYRERMTLDVPIIVRYQTCSEDVCYLPRTVELTLQVPLAELTR